MHDALAAGGVVVLPTDTVYGLVAVAADPTAADRLFELKGRDATVPVAVLCADPEQALALADAAAGAEVRAVAERWWPGPLTLVVPRRPGLGLRLGQPEHTIGLRVPDDHRIRGLARRLGPLAATSANRHGQPTVTSAAEATEVFGDAVAAIVDGGPLTDRASTVLEPPRGPGECSAMARSMPARSWPRPRQPGRRPGRLAPARAPHPGEIAPCRRSTRPSRPPSTTSVTSPCSRR